MIIKSIKFSDFRPFIGEQKIDFTCDDDKNVVVVLAKIASGKTTLILSFIWCLYGISKFEHPDEILNSKVESMMDINDKKDASVEVSLEHEGKVYTIRRTNTYRKQTNGIAVQDGMSKFSVTYVDENGETHSCGKNTLELNQTINTIMPQDLSSYFFFEGEKSNAVSTKDISDAVKRLIGLDTYTNMMQHLHGKTISHSADSVMGYFEKLSQDSSNIKATAELEKRNKAQQQLEEVLEKIKTADENYTYYNNKIEETNEKLRKAEPTKVLQIRRDEIKRSLERENANLEKAYNRFFESFSKNSFNLFIIPLLNSVRSKLDQMDLSDKGITGIDINAINQLLDRHECLCGTKLDEGTVAYRNVALYKDILPPKSVGILVKSMLDKATEKQFKGEDYVQEFIDLYRDIQLHITEIDRLERAENECLEELKKTDGLDSAAIEADLRLFTRRLDDFKNEQIHLNAEKLSLQSAIETHQNNYNMHSSVSDKTKRYYDCFCYASKIYEWVNSTYAKKESEIKTDLQHHFEELFDSIYAGERYAVIDKKYNLHVFTKSTNRELPLTGGLHVVTYFSFVGALVKLSTEIINKRNEEDEMFGENYPLVLDAAFSHTDKEHIESIARELSKTTKQLVFAVLDKDWQYAKDEISDKVKRIYYIEKISEDVSEIKLIEG